MLLITRENYYTINLKLLFKEYLLKIRKIMQFIEKRKIPLRFYRKKQKNQTLRLGFLYDTETSSA